MEGRTKPSGTRPAPACPAAHHHFFECIHYTILEQLKGISLHLHLSLCLSHSPTLCGIASWHQVRLSDKCRLIEEVLSDYDHIVVMAMAMDASLQSTGGCPDMVGLGIV